MKVKLRDNAWSLVRTDLGPSIRGQIDPPAYQRKQLKISTRIKSEKELLEVMIHECLHGCFWDIDEMAIDKAAVDISNVLYKLGARITMDKVTKRSRPKTK
jgi:hypothetical protein